MPTAKPNTDIVTHLTQAGLFFIIQGSNKTNGDKKMDVIDVKLGPTRRFYATINKLDATIFTASCQVTVFQYYEPYH